MKPVLSQYDLFTFSRGASDRGASNIEIARFLGISTAKVARILRRSKRYSPKHPFAIELLRSEVCWQPSLEVLRKHRQRGDIPMTLNVLGHLASRSERDWLFL